MTKTEAAIVAAGSQTEGEIKNFLLANPDIVLPVRDLAVDTSLISSGLIDSLAVLDIIAFLETHFDVQFEPEDLTGENFDCIFSMAELVRSRMKGAVGDS